MRDTAAKPIYSITPFTLLDYPDKTACIVWFAGCNMKCAYCYNPEIVYGKGRMSYYDAMNFIISRKDLLDGVVFSGGECTSHSNITVFAGAIKKLDMLVKVDTNGSNLRTVKRMIEEKVVDYIALDYKAPEAKFSEVTQSGLYRKFEETFDFLNASSVPFEVRTTVHSSILERADLQEMICFLKKKNYTGNFYLQNYVGEKQTIEELQMSERISLNELDTHGLSVIVRN